MTDFRALCAELADSIEILLEMRPVEAKPLQITEDRLARARAVLARWGSPAPQPIPVTERLPGPEDCIVNPRNGQGQWCWGWCVDDSAVPFSGRWRMMRRQWLADDAVAWLPAHALPVPS